MGTLVDKKALEKKAAKKSKAKQPFSGPEFEHEESKDRRKAKKRIEKEYAKIRFNFEEVRQSVAYVEAAQPFDDIEVRLKQLEKSVKRVRRGGVMGRGAKAHTSLLRKLRKMPIE